MHRQADFAEQVCLLGKALISAATTEQNSGYVSVAGYDRITIMLVVSIVTTTLDVDIEIATAAAGTNAATIKSITQLGASDDDKVILIDIEASELSNPSVSSAKEFGYVNVEVTPSGAATLTVLVWGWAAKYQPVTQTIIHEAVS